MEIERAGLDSPATTLRIDCERETYHDAGTDSNNTTAVSVGNDVTVADRQKSHDDHPHRVEHALVLAVVVAARAHLHVSRSARTPMFL